MEEIQYLCESVYKVKYSQKMLSKNPKCDMIISVNRISSRKMQHLLGKKMYQSINGDLIKGSFLSTCWRFPSFLNKQHTLPFLKADVLEVLISKIIPVMQ